MHDTPYSSPKLERFGTFRDLTLAGCLEETDGYTISGIGTATGSNPMDPGTTVCLGPDES